MVPFHIVLDGDPALPQKGGGHSPQFLCPQFLAHVCCGQTAGWINMPLGTELGLSPSHVVLDGDPCPPKGGSAANRPNFLRISIVAKRSSISATAEHLLWPPYGIGQAIIFLPCGFFLSYFFFFFPRLMSAAADWMSTILPHMVWPDRTARAANFRRDLEAT